jgi:hypothetical protein
MSIGLLKPVFVWTSSYMHSFFAVIIFEICVFIVGLIAVALLKKIPFIKKVL